MKNNYNYCHIAELTDKGCVRPANEDAMIHFESPNGLVSVVCDGMGGHVGGQIASHTAIEAIRSFLMQERGGTPSELIVSALNEANAAILRRTIIQPELQGMGSTCVILIVRDGKVYIGSVGDSRVYLIRNRTIKQLTVDQSYVQMLVDAGTILKEDAEQHPRKNEITNALGMQNMQAATVLPEAILPEAGDCFLLCSDGLSGMVSDRDICKIVSRQSDMSQQQRVETLVHVAKRNGGLDNITCQIVEFSVSPTNPSLIPWRKKNLKIWLPIAVVLFAAIVLLLFCNKKDKSVIEPTQADSSRKVTTPTRTPELKSFIPIQPDKYSDNEIVLSIEKRQGVEGYIVMQKIPNDTMFTINEALLLKRMLVFPSSHVTVEFNDDSSGCDIKLMSKAEEKITIDLYDTTDQVAYRFTLPIEKSEEAKSVKENGSVKQLFKSLFGSKPKADRGYNDIRVAVSNQNVTVVLLNVSGSDTDTTFYFPDYVFDARSGDWGWYNLQCDGSRCIITIKTNTNIEIPSSPDSAIISIPARFEGEEIDPIKVRVIKK